MRFVIIAKKIIFFFIKIKYLINKAIISISPKFLELFMIEAKFIIVKINRIFLCNISFSLFYRLIFVHYLIITKLFKMFYKNYNFK